MRSANRLPLEALTPYLLELPKPAPPRTPPQFDWLAIFGNDRPVEIEIGFGKGGWLVDAAAARRDRNFLGIEVMRALQLYAATRLAKRELTNARVACGDARWVLQSLVAPGSVKAVHVYFPDPWWKKRHKKRRVFTAEFANAVARALIPDGRLCIATDVAEYFEVMTQLVAELPQLTEIYHRTESGPPTEGELLTNFERKARIQGGAVWRAEYQRKDGP